MVSSLRVFFLISFSFSPTFDEKFNLNHGSTLVNSILRTCYWLLYSQVGLIDRVGTIKSVRKYFLRRFNLIFWSFRSNDIKGGLYSSLTTPTPPQSFSNSRKWKDFRNCNSECFVRPLIIFLLVLLVASHRSPKPIAHSFFYFMYFPCLISTPIQTIPNQILLGNTFSYNHCDSCLIDC